MTIEVKETKEASPEQPEKPKKLKIKKKKKSVTEKTVVEEEKSLEVTPFKVQLKTRKKVKIHQAQEVEESVPVEEVDDFSPLLPTQIQFTETEDTIELDKPSTQGWSSTEDCIPLKVYEGRFKSR